MRTGQKLNSKGRVTLLETRQAAERLEQRGRGAVSNQTGRFEPETRHAFDDGWDTVEEAAARLETTLTQESAKTIITFNKSPDISFDRTINPYRGCEHGCIYCFARPSHAYGGLSAGLDFESRLFFKPNAPELLKRELSRPGYRPRPIALGMNTDAFQPVERDTGLTREVLKILLAYRHPVSLLTKSSLIERDIDIIGPMASMGLARVGVSVTTLDRTLARKMEPRAGIPVTVMTAPIIPGLTDHEIESLLEAAAAHGASGAGYVLLRLPYEIKDLFHEWLVAHVPDRAAKVINTIREMRRGQDYDARWFERGTGRGPVAQMIGQRFARETKRLGLDTPRPDLRTDLFRPLDTPGGQLSLGF